MWDTVLGSFLKKLFFSAAGAGVLIGLDLILGGKLVAALKQVFDRPVNTDDLLNNSKNRTIAGLVILILSWVMILLLASVTTVK